ncbi:hypothetical protein OM190_13700 [Escherichia albertii]|uniref:hypothetical protein n=1 Tax=Escherichia albertii TaxID=208962 RepID=UPI000743B20B|nr:hypothetical protein [Escherichia albertii]HAV9944871.1 hypothetical protein [Escherichia coli]MCZ8928708.1 hypothetical protein [Escherichia albertii]MCZ9044575.1 hypothetical protein [Escherichia albertii]MCZ9049601.1 hypothetical protein [Escherichia albertii]MCZ9076958.1 hypothetical protein [Escherichia albertii]
MNDKELKKTPPQTLKGQRKKIAHEHESERFAPCSFALEKFLKEHKKKLSLQTRERTESD